MTQSTTPSSPGAPSNVVAMPTAWPGPMFNPAGGPVPPSCFSQLAALNACYDSVQMMEAILSKVMVNLIQTDPAVIAAITAELAKVGAGMPITGVTDGSHAQPGIVGEVIGGSALNVAFNPGGVSYVAPLTIPPGDWDLEAFMNLTPAAASVVSGVLFEFGPTTPPGTLLPNNVAGGFLQSAAVATAENLWIASNSCPISVSTPTLPSWAVSYNGSQAASFSFYVWARRRR